MTNIATKGKKSNGVVNIAKSRHTDVSDWEYKDGILTDENGVKTNLKKGEKIDFLTSDESEINYLAANLNRKFNLKLTLKDFDQVGYSGGRR